MPDTNIATPQLRRCAIYARKSSEHGIDQDFNSLEAQCDLCASYINSQRHRGWTAIDKPYVDAGMSGGTLDRPALQELLADVEEGRVDVIVIYKLDRLSRSLLDFVRLLAVLDRNAVSFVCITQNFDTGDSLGRLIMNVLLTFAQFEREITGDRIRDKRRCTAARGIWIGSHAPYGYDYIDKRLVLNPQESANVRWLFERYVELGSTMALWREATRKELLTKVRVRRSGELVGGKPMTHGSIRFILRNPVYRGAVVHIGNEFPGIHEAIVPAALWHNVGSLLRSHASMRNEAAPADLLPAVVFDAYGRRMAVLRSYRRGGCERFYRSYPTAWGKAHKVRPVRAHAPTVEQLVCASLARFMSEPASIRDVLLRNGRRGENLAAACAACDLAARRITGMPQEQRIAALAGLLEHIEICKDHIKLLVRLDELERFLSWDGLTLFKRLEQSKTHAYGTHLLTVAATVTRRSRLTLPIAERSPASNKTADVKLVHLINKARHVQKLVEEERGQSVASLAKRMSRGTSHFLKLLRLNYLAPDIVISILDGDQPAHLTRRKLLDADLPTDWALQRKMFGFPQQPES